VCIFNFSSSFLLFHLSHCLSVHSPPTFTHQYKPCSSPLCNIVHPLLLNLASEQKSLSAPGLTQYFKCFYPAKHKHKHSPSNTNTKTLHPTKTQTLTIQHKHKHSTSNTKFSVTETVYSQLRPAVCNLCHVFEKLFTICSVSNN